MKTVDKMGRLTAPSDCQKTEFYKRKGSENEEFSEFNPQECGLIALFAEENGVFQGF